MKVEKHQNLELIIKIWRFGFYFFLGNLANLAEKEEEEKKKHSWRLK